MEQLTKDYTPSRSVTKLAGMKEQDLMKVVSYSSVSPKKSLLDKNSTPIA